MLEESYYLFYFLNIVLGGQKQLNLPEIERRVLEFWEKNKIFKKSLEKTKNGKKFVFYEGPPTANAKPGIHHVLARVFKDIIPRYKTMRGYFVSRRAGWDTQGLPVEIEIEKKLGLKSKQEIEKYGIAKFNRLAKESVWQYKDEWEKLTERVGFWLDLKNPYITYSNNYLEKLWGIFKEIHKRGLLKKFYKVVPWCPRCQTPLSSHELGQPGAYKKVEDPSVYIKFEIRNPKSETKKRKEFLLVWTTTPWTLPANVAIAVNPGLSYTKFKIKGEYLWSVNTPPFAPETEIEVIEKLSGSKLEGWQYEPLYKNKGPHKIFAADFVSMKEGTGLVHIAPAFGEDDLNLMKGRLPSEDIPLTVDDRGLVTADVPGGGKFIKEADKDILTDLAKRNLLYYQTVIEHEYPFCWRCDNPLIYFARNSWFIEMSKLRNDLLKENEKINWIPAHLKEGRFGEWLREIKDWAISRERYWGTPLPIWECEKCGDVLVAGGLADLDKHAVRKNRYWIMRHGQSLHNLGEQWIAVDGKGNRQSSELTALGIRQAEKAGQALAGEKIAVIYCSPFKRTRQTAAIVNKHVKAKLVFDKRLTDIDCGVFNGQAVTKHRDFAPGIEAFTKKAEGGENLTDVRRRMMAFWREINARHSDQNILIVSHGDPLWMLEAALNGLSEEEALDWNYLKVGTPRKLPTRNWPFDEEGGLDLHRPYIDDVKLRCLKCKSLMFRVKEVADVWFDSGAMPFASGEYDAGRYPADYICEAVDQTRGWFYTLLAVAVLLKKGTPYRNVISLGHLLDKHGQKMSKSKGNVVDPWEMTDGYGADVIRWYFYTVNPPGEPKKFDELDLAKTRNKFHNLLYNSYVFYETHKIPGRRDLRTSDIHILDRWVSARLNETIDLATKNLEKYEIGEAAKTIEVFVDDLSRWYIRRSRKRAEALPVLKAVLMELSKLIAPFTPFFAESLWLSLGGKNSAHLADWPKTDKKLIDRNLLEQMAAARHLASLALAKRAEAGIKVRQPLASLKIRNPKYHKELLDILKDEINVKEIVFDEKIKNEIELDAIITPELRKEGLVRDLIREVQDLRHKENLKPSDKITLLLKLPKEEKEAVETADYFRESVNAKKLAIEQGEKMEIELKKA